MSIFPAMERAGHQEGLGKGLRDTLHTARPCLHAARCQDVKPRMLSRQRQGALLEGNPAPALKAA